MNEKPNDEIDDDELDGADAAATSLSATVPEGGSGRLDRFLAEAFADLSRSRIKALIEEGNVRLNGANAPGTILSASRAVKPGETFSVVIPPPEAPLPLPEDIPLDVVYEDEHLIVVNKAPGMVVHPAAGSPNGTLVNALLFHCGDSLSGIGGVKRPGIVHRIDKDTSGLLVMAKHDKAHAGLAAQFADHSIERLYAAICRGIPSPVAGRIEGNIARHPVDRKRMAVTPTGGKWAATHYRTIHAFAHNGHPVAVLIECKLETGRTHQVRVHMTHIGHPLVGDPVYGRTHKLPSTTPAAARGAILGFTRQALHARVLGFVHPVTGETLRFESELPHDMMSLLGALDPLRLSDT
ncbi:RluA family pseudouridine synthase [Pseudokordiimonas caeni]|uniref:RluA family pseudouridine synthase n=1 Tax=Pseudokordiimonas caeni TaxID=2997908 RepID=UPI0028126F9A|nr:RluA family pseudouridine synthase [Pseudokordiimonas caeni]